MSLSSINDMDPHNLIVGLYTDALESNASLSEPQFTIRGNDYSTLTWTGTTMPKPTEAELFSKYNSIKTDIRDKLVRERRDKLLVDSDKYAVKDYPFRTKSKKDQWTTYRSNLRNLTSDLSSFTLDLNNFEITNFDTVASAHSAIAPADEGGEDITFNTDDVIVDGKLIMTTNTSNYMLVGDGTSYEEKSPSQVRSALDLEVGTDVQAYDIVLNALSGITPSSNKIAMFKNGTTCSLLDFKDQDNMISNSATAIPSQQSVKAYVDNEISSLVDSAPGTLNTLNELAAALGDDANYATTITTELSGKQATITSSSDISMNDLLATGDITCNSTIKVDTINEKTNTSGVTIEGVLIKNNGITAGSNGTITATNFNVGSKNIISATAQGSFTDIEIKNNSNAVTFLAQGSSGDLDLSGTLSVDTISEKTSATGVTIEGVVIKNNGITAGSNGTSTGIPTLSLISRNGNSIGDTWHIKNESSTLKFMNDKTTKGTVDDLIFELTGNANPLLSETVVKGVLKVENYFEVADTIKLVADRKLYWGDQNTYISGNSGTMNIDGDDSINMYADNFTRIYSPKMKLEGNSETNVDFEIKNTYGSSAGTASLTLISDNGDDAGDAWQIMADGIDLFVTSDARSSPPAYMLQLKNNATQASRFMYVYGGMDVRENIRFPHDKRVYWGSSNDTNYILATSTTMTIESNDNLLLNADTEITADTPLATFTGNVDVGEGIDVTGNITCSGSLDIEDSIAMSTGKKIQWVNADTYISGTDGGITIESHDTLVMNADISLTVTSPLTTFSGNTDFSSGIDVTGNITCSGSLDIEDSIAMSTGKKIQWVNEETYISGTDTAINIDGHRYINMHSDDLTTVNTPSFNIYHTSHADLVIKSFYTSNGESRITMISDNSENIGDSIQIMTLNGTTTFNTDHEVIGTYDKPILSLLGNITQSSRKVKIYGKLEVYNGFSVDLGSDDADADMFYRNSSGDFARLAKGTAGQVLKMNDGETAPEWGDSSSGGVTMNGSTSNGVLTYNSSNEATVESTLKYDGTTLTIGNQTINSSTTEFSGTSMSAIRCRTYGLQPDNAGKFGIALLGDRAGGDQNPVGVNLTPTQSTNTVLRQHNTYGNNELTYQPSTTTLFSGGFTSTNVTSTNVICSNINSGTNTNIEIDPNGSGVVVFKGSATRGSGQIKLNCEENSHGIIIKGPPHSAEAGYTLTLPDNDGDADQVLKTDGSGNLSWTAQTGGGGGVTMDGTTSNGVLTYNSSNEATVESSLLYDGTSLNIGTTGVFAGGVTIYKTGYISMRNQLRFYGTSESGTSPYIGFSAPTTVSSTLNFILPPSYGTDGQLLTTDGSGNLSWTTVTGGGGGSLPSGVTYNNEIFTVTGNIRASQDITAFYSSDRRFKDNLVRISEPNEKIKKINGYEFDWNDKHELYKNTHDVGVVAQEIEEVLPEIVVERDDGYKAVKYEKIIALLIESNKDLLRRVEELEEEVKNK